MKLSDYYGFGRQKKTNHTFLRIFGGAALALIGAGLIISLPDIKRYIRISTM